MQAFNSILALFFVAFAMTIALPLDVDWEFERMMNGTNGTWGNGTWDMRATTGNETWGTYGTWGNGTWGTYGNETWGTYGNGTFGAY